MGTDLPENVIAGSDILIVDDEPNNLSVLKNILAECGARVRPALSGELALKAMRSRCPDIILLDVLMPKGMNGFEVCEIIKCDGSLRHVPVLFISALTDTADKLRAFQAGGQDYIDKPFQAEEVLARVESHLKLLRMRKRLEEQNEQLRVEIEGRKKAQQALAVANSELEMLANLDGLTKVANRRVFDSALDREWRRAKRQGISIALALCDIDYFKRFNDAYGHQAGDDCLRRIAETIQNVLKRQSDLLARYGGEEFALILPDTNIDGGGHIAREMVRAVADAAVPHRDSDAAEMVTISVGVAAVRPSPDIAPSDLLARADAALYRAKNKGRNQVEVAED